MVMRDKLHAERALGCKTMPKDLREWKGGASRAIVMEEGHYGFHPCIVRVPRVIRQNALQRTVGPGV